MKVEQILITSVCYRKEAEPQSLEKRKRKKHKRHTTKTFPDNEITS